jgi:hypothetical protein
MIRYLQWLAVAIVVLTSVFPARALETDSEGWFQITATGPVTERLLAFVEAQPRIGTKSDSDDVDMRTMIARGALGWRVLPGWSLWTGYGYTPTFNPERDEHRVFQQSLYEWQPGPFSASNRTRLEQRWLEHAHDTSWRLRNQLRFAYPLPGHPTIALVVADEIFANLNTVDTAPVSGFDQNRFFAGISYQVNSVLRIEVDYVNQVVNGRRHAEDTLRNSGMLVMAFGW